MFIHISADIGSLTIHSSDSGVNSQHSSNLQNGIDTGQRMNTSATSKIQVCDNLEQSEQDLSDNSEGHGTSSKAIAAKMKQTYNSVPNVESKKQDDVKTKVPNPKSQSERTKVSSHRGQGQSSPIGQGQVSPRGQGQLSPRGQGSFRGQSQMSPGEKAVPTTSFQFQADYKSLKHTPEGFYHYLKVEYIQSFEMSEYYTDNNNHIHYNK